ncbi:FadR/GntR family transcriptional regulator [Arthrobacter sp. MMS18-M83]|uniref:FadR/GntR family transcriptional regulator n=1 Tax=Arthrobacter sp. MMS18-M83 TaxID=2996261 RepID=UPI00227B03AB|nr:GntR family transcriptional regulator [Arthrobacter sp. MMS18-M83]WAH96296.1 GntR family transcriptional regulator [Arthrobacter sp. MMS18-M83]
MAEVEQIAAREGADPFTAKKDADQPMFTRVRPRRGFEYVSEQIRDAVSEGRLKPGGRLPAEREMAQIFGVSRQGVREALRGLEMSGLVESKPGVNGGVFILPGDPGVVTRAVNDLASLGVLSAESLLEARILLTSDVLRLVCERATEEDFKRLEDDIATVEQFEDSIDEVGAVRTIRITHFYSLLAEATHNEVLVMLMNSLTHVVQLRLNRVGPRPLTNVGAVRRKLLKHLRNGEAEAAVKELTAHLKRLEARLEEREGQLASAAS